MLRVYHIKSMLRVDHEPFHFIRGRQGHIDGCEKYQKFKHVLRDLHFGKEGRAECLRKSKSQERSPCDRMLTSERAPETKKKTLFLFNRHIDKHGCGDETFLRDPS